MDPIFKQQLEERREARLAADAERRRRPHWLYRCYDKDGRLLYIGQTSNPKGRMAVWRSVKTGIEYGWFREVTSMRWCEYPNWWVVCMAEREAIKAERPAHNRQHNVLAVVPA